MTSELLLKIALSMLTILSAVVTGVLIPYAKAKIELGKRQNTYAIVQFAVQAAEQVFKNQVGAGKDKNQMVANYLRSKGINAENKDVETMIEAAVLEVNKWTTELVDE